MEYASFYGNIYRCPFNRRLKTCPFYSQNQISFEEKLAWFEDMGIAEKDTIVKHHNRCAAERSKSHVIF